MHLDSGGGTNEALSAFKQVTQKSMSSRITHSSVGSDGKECSPAGPSVLT
jgi:hypothetical protein